MEVTPCMGVWLKQIKDFGSIGQVKSHPVWVCGLKLPHSQPKSTIRRHTLYGCVDWNYWVIIALMIKWVTPCMGVWIETL